MAVRSRALLALAVLASLISFAKFSPCQGTTWATPDQYIHACYSDLPSLFGARGLDKNQWPYTSDDNAVEYPVLTGLVMFATAALTDSPITYFHINAFLLALLFIGLVFVVNRIKPSFSYLLPVAPAMIASLYINWDLWAIFTMMLAIYWSIQCPRNWCLNLDKVLTDLSALTYRLYPLAPRSYKRVDQVFHHCSWSMDCNQSAIHSDNSDRVVPILQTQS